MDSDGVTDRGEEMKFLFLSKGLRSDQKASSSRRVRVMSIFVQKLYNPRII